MGLSYTAGKYGAEDYDDVAFLQISKQIPLAGTGPSERSLTQSSLDLSLQVDRPETVAIGNFEYFPNFLWIH